MLAVSIGAARNLKQPLSRVTAAVNQAVPLEACILLRAADDELTLTGLDSRTHQLCLRVPDTNLWAPGSCLLDADLFNRMFGTLSDDEPVDLVIGDGKLVVQGSSKMEIDLYPANIQEFPIEYDLPDAKFYVDGEYLVEVVKKALTLGEKNDFITFVVHNEEFKIYTKYGGRMYSRSLLDCSACDKPIGVSMPMSLLTKTPQTFNGRVQFRFNEDNTIFAMSSEVEHLLIRQVGPDLLSKSIDSLIDAKSDNYWVVRADKLSSDIKRATILKDPKGLKLEKVENTNRLMASCSAPGKAKVETMHEIIDSSKTITTINLDAFLLDRAIKAIEPVEVVCEEIVEKINVGDEVEEIVNIKITDRDTPDNRVIVLTTLQV